MDRMITYKGELMTTNQWVYKVVREILPTERIAVWGRYQGKLGNPQSSFGLLELPVKYLELNIRAEPPVYHEIRAKEFMRGHEIGLSQFGVLLYKDISGNFFFVKKIQWKWNLCFFESLAIQGYSNPN